MCIYALRIHYSALPYIYTNFYTLYTLNTYIIQEGSIHSDCMADVIESWIDQLLITDNLIKAPYNYTNILNIRYKYPIPNTIKWIFCQKEACVIKKEDEEEG